MENATTVLVPVGDFTADSARNVTRSLDDAAAHGRSIVISLECTARWSWGALCELAESLRGRRGTSVAFARVSPTGRALLREVGLGSTWIITDAPSAAAAARHVLITAEQ